MMHHFGTPGAPAFIVTSLPVFSCALFVAVALTACVKQEQKSQFEQKIEALCADKGYSRGSEEFKLCVEETRQQELDAVRAAYDRLLRGEGID